MESFNTRRLSLYMRACLYFTACTLLTGGALYAQETGDMQIFGSMQSLFMYQDSQLRATFPDPAMDFKLSETRNSFALQQLDLFLSKEIDESFSAFIDLEFQLNYSSDKHWGSMSVQEAWLNYHYLDELSFKAGLLYPAFNHLNEIKNRLALMPYIYRPMVYERLLSERFFTEDFIPEHAFIQVSGSHATGPVFLDYAVFAGNAEGSYITKRNPDGSLSSDVNQKFEFLSGIDPTNLNLKLIGGRIGFRTRDEQWKAGISITHDYNNLRDTVRMPSEGLPPATRQLLGDDAERIRIGADVSMRCGDFWFEGELIKVTYDYEPAEKLDLHAEQGFAYGTLGYEFTPATTAYASLQWGDYFFGVDSDYFVYTVGGAWRLNQAITAKAQFLVYDELHENYTPDIQTIPAHKERVTITFTMLGLSILL